MYLLDIVLLRHGSTDKSKSVNKTVPGWLKQQIMVRGTVTDQTYLVWEETFIWYSCDRHQNRWQDKALCHHCNIHGAAHVTSHWKIKEYHSDQAGFQKLDIFFIWWQFWWQNFWVKSKIDGSIINALESKCSVHEFEMGGLSHSKLMVIWTVHNLFRPSLRNVHFELDYYFQNLYQENFILKTGRRFKRFFKSQETQKSSVRVSARSPERKWRQLRQWKFLKDKMRSAIDYPIHIQLSR